MTLDYPHFEEKSVENLPSLGQATPTHMFQLGDERVTVFETVRGEYVALYDLADGSREYYAVSPDPSIEYATLGLMDDGWELTEFDAESADRRIQDQMRREFGE